MAEDDTKVFHYGESVIMAGGDRPFEGVVVAAFRGRSSGKWCYVVEGDRGVQQTFSSAQLLRRGAQAPVGKNSSLDSAEGEDWR